MKKTIDFETGTPPKEGWYLVIGKKEKIVDAYFKDGNFYFLNVLNPFSNDGTPGRNLSTYMMLITNVIGWMKSIDN